MTNKYTQTYFNQLLERYILTVIYKEQKIIDEMAETSPEILIVPHLHKFNYIITDSFSPTETDAELIEIYETYTKFGYNIEKIIELSLPVWHKYKAISDKEKRANPINQNTSPLTEADKQDIVNADILYSLFIDEAVYNSFTHVLLAPLLWGKVNDIQYIKHYIMLIHQCKSEGLLNDFTNVPLGDEFVEEDAKVDFYVRCFFGKKDIFANEDIYVACKNECTELIKEMFYGAETKNRDEYAIIIDTILEKYEKISDDLQPKPIIENKKLVHIMDEEYVPRIQEPDQTQYSIMESSTIYELDFDKDGKRECHKFFIRYEALKTLREYRYENKSVDEMMEEMEDFYTKLKIPNPPIYTVTSLLNKKHEMKVYQLPHDQEQKKEIQHPYSLLWLKNNKTAFVQLVYGLFYAKKIGLKWGKQEISQMVISFSEITSFVLGNSWQTNHSTSITKRSKDYEAEVFLKIKTAYQSDRKNFPSNNSYTIPDSEIEASNLVCWGSENELIQFVYGLYYAKFVDLQKEKGDLPLMIFIFAKLPNVELSTTCIEDSIHDMLFWNEVQQGYRTYREEMKDKNEIG